MGAELECDYTGLLHLLKASNKKTVVEVCGKVAEVICGSSASGIVTSVRNDLDVSEAEANSLVKDLTKLLSDVLYNGSNDTTSIKKALPVDFHPNLSDLLAKIIADNFDRWRGDVLRNQVSFPKLDEMTWEVRSNQETTRQATCVFKIKTVGSESPVRIEMSKASLDTMLHSLATIRNQISSVAPS